MGALAEISPVEELIKVGVKPFAEYTPPGRLAVGVRDVSILHTILEVEFELPRQSLDRSGIQPTDSLL